MKTLATLLLFVTTLCSGQELEQLRSSYPEAIDSKEITYRLLEKISSPKEHKYTLLAYKGALLTLKAKFEKGIQVKKQFFKAGAKLLDNAVANAPKNIEIRCLRLGVQENSPKILGYKKQIQIDKQFMLSHYKSVSDVSLQAFINGYISHSKVFTDAEKQLF